MKKRTLTRSYNFLVSDMKTRYIFANDPIIYRWNGVLLSEDETPSVMSLRTFFNGILDSLFVEKNPASRHICSDLCWQKAQVIISAKKRGNSIGKAVPRNSLKSRLNVPSNNQLGIKL